MEDQYLLIKLSPLGEKGGMKEGRRSRKTVGSLKPNTRLKIHPSPPFTFILCLLITHTGTKESTSQGVSHGTLRRERQDRVRQRDGKREKETEDFS